MLCEGVGEGLQGLRRVPSAKVSSCSELQIGI